MAEATLDSLFDLASINQCLDSTRKCNRRIEEYFKRGLEVKALSGAMIEFVGHENGQRFRDRQEITSFWEVLADEAIGVFVDAAFPSLVRMAEIEGCIRAFAICTCSAKYRAILLS